MLDGMKLSADGWLCDVPVWGGVLSMRALHSPPATHNLEHAQPLWLEARKQKSACIFEIPDSDSLIYLQAQSQKPMPSQL
jgi:hypothetical protein